MPSTRPYYRTACGCLALAASLAAGCATPAPSSPPADSSRAAEPAISPPQYIPVVRYGRYTLVELEPTEVQRDLLLQVIDVSLPDTVQATVAGALNHVLRRSGYRLCSGPETDGLDALPLPAAHYRIGPMVLRDALLTLAGPAWRLHVDEGARVVCFTPATIAAEPAGAIPSPVGNVDNPAATLPLAEAVQP
jgi:conjugative transfer region protein (TIGR03748 family)